MAKPTREYKIGDHVSKGTFEKFIRHFPNMWLREHKIERPSFYAVAHGLIEIGEFKTGENFRLSQVAISEITGASLPTIRKVLHLLEATGAVRVAEVSKRPGGGMPVKNYTLVYSKIMHDVLTMKDRDARREEWKRAPRGMEESAESSTGNHNTSALETTTPVHWKPQPQSLETTTPVTGNHNPITGLSMTDNQESSDESSPAPVVALSPGGASDGAAESKNRKLAMDPTELDALLRHGSGEPQDCLPAPQAQSADPELDALLANPDLDAFLADLEL